MNKLVRLVVQLICLAATIVGAILLDSSGREYEATCACLCVGFLIITSQVGHSFHTMSIAFVLALSGALVAGGVATDASKHDAGYALTIVGMWVAFAFTWENTWDQTRAIVPAHLVSPVINIVGFVAVLLNWLGCILLWAANDGKNWADNGTVAFVSGFVFIAAWFYVQSPVAFWVGFFWFPWMQYFALSGPVNGCGAGGNTDDDLCTAGGVFVWIAHIVFLAVMIIETRGKSAESTASGCGAMVRVWQFWVYLIALILVIIGAIVAADRGMDGWLSANAVASVFFLLVACLLGPGSGDSAGTDRESAFQIIALALCVATSPALVQAADGDRRNGGEDRVAGGCALMLMAMWGCFALAAFSALRGGGNVLVAGLMLVVTVLVTLLQFAGLVMIWYISDKYNGLYLSTGILILLVLLVWLWAVGAKRGGFTVCVSIFFTAYVQISVGSAALAMRNADTDDGRTLLAGMIISWICMVVELVALYVVIAAEATCGTGGAGRAGPFATAQPNQGSAVQPNN